MMEDRLNTGILDLAKMNELPGLLPYLTPRERARLDKLILGNDPYARFINPDPVSWIQRHFYIPETGAPMKLYPSQIEPLREATSRQQDGQFKYSTIVWSAIKKSAKSSIAAGMGLYTAWQKPWSTVRVIANDLKQADSRVAYYMRRAIALNPAWKDIIKVVSYKITLPNHSTIEAVPIDPEGEAGGGDDLVIYSELWGWKSKAEMRMWTESTLSPLKMGYSQRWIDTYAGFTGESPLLEQLHEQGLINGHVIDEENEMYANGRLFVLWNTKPRLPWQSKEYYEQESTTLTDSEFRRVHKNEFVSSTDSFIQPEWWAACKGELPALDKNDPIILVMDAAISGDCFGILGVSRHDGKTAPRFVRKWTPPTGGKIIYKPPSDGDPSDVTYPSGFIRFLVEKYNVIEVAYDPYQLYSLATEMAQDLVCYFRPFNQQGDRLLADKALQDAIKSKEIIQDGNEDLTEHIINAAAASEGEKSIRIVKKSNSKKIDLAVCLSMGHHEAVRLGL